MVACKSISCAFDFNIPRQFSQTYESLLHTIFTSIDVSMISKKWNIHSLSHFLLYTSFLFHIFSHSHFSFLAQHRLLRPGIISRDVNSVCCAERMDVGGSSLSLVKRRAKINNHGIFFAIFHIHFQSFSSTVFHSGSICRASSFGLFGHRSIQLAVLLLLWTTLN